MTSEREVPDAPGVLYEARGDVPLARPLMQGDVFRDIRLAGNGDGPTMVMVVQHPCSMRSGPTLRPRLTVTPVREHAPLSTASWQGYGHLMPLPDLLTENGQYYGADFREVATVASADLRRDLRVAALSNYGIHVLQQRHVFYMTRFTIDVPTLAQTFEGISAEMELLYEWVEAALDHAEEGIDVVPVITTSEAEFDTYLSESSGQRRNALKEAVTRADVRRDVRRHIADLYPDG